jgi:single-strand DNA-binding protein
MSRNSVRLIGHVGKDPEIRYMTNDNSVANFTMATTESYKNRDGERVEKTEWHRCVAWRHLATLAEKYIVKGTFLAVEGKIEYRSYEDANGEKKYITEIKLTEIIFLGKNDNSKSEQNGQPQSEPQQQQQQYSSPNASIDDEEVGDLPF